MRRHSSQHRHLKPRGFFGRLGHLFRERQVYVRSKGQVQFVTLSPAMQFFGLFMLVTGFFWIAFAAINVTFKDELIAVKERHLYQAQLDHEERIAELRKTIDKLNHKLLLNQQGYLAEVDKVRSEYRSLVARQDRLADFFRQGWMPVRQTKSQPDQSSVSPTGRGASGKQNFLPLPTKGKQGLNNQKSNLGDMSFGQKYAETFTTRKQALAPLRDLRAEMAQLEKKQIALLSQVIQKAATNEKKVRRIYARLGVNANRILAKQQRKLPDAVGGPFVAADLSVLGSRKLVDQLQKTTIALNRVELLERGASTLPLAMPLHHIIRFSSPFGLRRDPLRRVAAMHTGIDIKAKYAANVRATADGVVIFAGWAGGYGRMVKIQHENGISTRYAHLSKIMVKAQQRVKKGQPIGLLGSSGRSTGPHVHYETRLNGKAMNPARFWKARNDFQSLSQKK